MLKAFIDDSVDEGRFLVMGGFVATPERWERFSDEWAKWLRHAKLEVFKATEFWDRRGNEEHWEHGKWFYGAIRDHVQGALTIVIPIDALDRVFARFQLSRVLKNPYFWAIKGIVNTTAQSQIEWGAREPIDFVFDERKEENRVREVWDYYKQTASPEVRALTGHKPIFEDDERVLPLQAADMWAWWCRKRCAEQGKLKRGEFPMPWGDYDEIPAMIFQMSEDDLETEFIRIAHHVAVASRSP